MGSVDDFSRRLLLRRIALAASLACVATSRSEHAHAADAPLIAEDDPAAKAVKYVADASKAKGAPPGNTCGNCALYQGKYASKEGPCQIFPGKNVTAAGWCASWAPQM
jgi:hypothetical protein